MSFGAAPGGGGMDEYQRLMAERNAAAKKKRMLFGLVAVAAVGAVGYYVMTNRKKNEAAQQVLDAGGRFAERDKIDMGAFWTCLMGTDTDVGMFQNADQIQQRVESAYFTQQKTYSDHLTTECVPKLEGARGSLSGLAERDAGRRSAAAREVRRGAAQDAGGPGELRGEAEVARRDQGRRRQHSGGRRRVHRPMPTAESVAFEKFMVCAIPDLDKKKDIQGVLEFLAETCKKDPVAVHDQGARGLRQPGAERGQGREAGPVEDVQGQREEVLRGAAAPAAGVGVVRQEVAQGQEGAGPRGVPDRGRRLHRGARRGGQDGARRGRTHHRPAAARREEEAGRSGRAAAPAAKPAK